MNLFDLAAVIKLDSSQFESGMKEAESAGSNFGEKLKSGLGTAAKIGGASIAAVGTAAVAAGKKLYSEASEVASYGDQIDKMSQKLGLSTDAYQEWDYVLGQAGVEITSMSTGLKTLTNKIDDAKNGSADAQAMFANLGISLEDLNSMSREDIFAATITGFQRMADSTERAALANDLFGRSGQELTPLFNSSIEDTNKLREAAHELGFVMSSEEVKASAAFNDSLDTMKRTMDGVKRKLTVQFLPAFTKSFNAIAGLLSKNGKDATKYKKELESGISEIVKGISDVIPEAVEIATNGAAAVVEAVAKQLPKELPNILNSAIKAAGSLAKSLVKAIPDIFGGIGAALGAVITNIPNIAGLAWDILKGLGKGLIDGLANFGKEIASGFEGLFSEPISEDVRIANEKIAALAEKMEGVGEVTEDMKESMAKADADEMFAEHWLEVFKELSEKTTLTKQEEEKLKKAVEELNKVLPETQQIVKDETGKWVANTGAIEANIKAMKHRAYAEIYQDKARKYMEQVADLTLAMKDEQNTLYDLEDAFKRQRTDYRLAAADLKGFKDEYNMINETQGMIYSSWDEGSDAMRAYAESIGITHDKFRDWESVIVEAEARLVEMDKEVIATGYSIDSQKRVIKGYEDSIGELNTTIDKFFDYATGELVAAAELAPDIGEEVAKGFAAGMEIHVRDVRAAAGGLTRAAMDEMKKVALIASPSKRVRREVGEMIGKGLALGLDDEMRAVEKASNNLAEAAIPDPIFNANRFSASSRYEQSERRPIYMILDSGELVGATTKKYDEALGVENSLKLRWGGATA
jgi:hypothetical protein